MMELKQQNEDYQRCNEEAFKAMQAPHKNAMDNLQEQIRDISISRASSRSASRNHSPAPDTGKPNMLGNFMSLPRVPEDSHMESMPKYQYNPTMNPTKPTIRDTKKEYITATSFASYLSRNKELLRLIKPLVHSQGAAYTKWLSVLRKQMETYEIPEEFFIQIALSKLPEEIAVRVIDTNIEDENQLDEILFKIYCGASNAVNMKKNFIKENKLAPRDRNFDALRSKIMDVQVPNLISVMRIGYNRPSMIREALINQASFTYGSELFLEAIQPDTKASVLNKGKYQSVDELVSRANDFASSIDDGQLLLTSLTN